jgi:hypothetical protein
VPDPFDAINFCGATQPAVDLPDAGEGACCVGSAVYGPDRCTCWADIHDQDQQTAQTDLLPMPAIPVEMCADCAYRPGSPERTGQAGYQGDTGSLDELVESGAPFYCHQGMRRVTHLAHPSGVTVPAHPGNYTPLIVGNVPYKADGTPGNICAGWMLRRLKAFYRNERQNDDA